MLKVEEGESLLVSHKQEVTLGIVAECHGGLDLHLLRTAQIGGVASCLARLVVVDDQSVGGGDEQVASAVEAEVHAVDVVALLVLHALPLTRLGVEPDEGMDGRCAPDVLTVVGDDTPGIVGGRKAVADVVGLVLMGRRHLKKAVAVGAHPDGVVVHIFGEGRHGEVGQGGLFGCAIRMLHIESISVGTNPEVAP